MLAGKRALVLYADCCSPRAFATAKAGSLDRVCTPYTCARADSCAAVPMCTPPAPEPLRPAFCACCLRLNAAKIALIQSILHSLCSLIRSRPRGVLVSAGGRAGRDRMAVHEMAQQVD